MTPSGRSPLAHVVVVDDADGLTIAIALLYNREFLAAPLAAANATGDAAHEVLSVAFAIDVPIVPHLTVARELAPLELGDEIETSMYSLVAEFLVGVRARPA